MLASGCRVPAKRAGRIFAIGGSGALIRACQIGSRMLLAIVAALLPVVATLSLGYFAAWHRDFAAAEATILNRMVMDYALPLSLFAGTMALRRDDLVADVPTALAISGSMLATYIFVVLMARLVWRRDLGSSALQA